MQLKMYLTLGLLILLVIFTVQNATVVPLTFLFWKMEISRALLIFFAFIIGMIIGWLSRNHMQHIRQHKRAKKPD